MGEAMTIGEVAERCGVATSALRFYEDQGLIHAERTDSGHRRYPRAVIRRVAFITFAQKVGLSLDEIRSLTSNRSGDTCGSVREMLTRHIAAIDQQMKELHELRSTLSNYRHRCEAALEEQSNAPCPTVVDLERSQA